MTNLPELSEMARRCLIALSWKVKFCNFEKVLILMIGLSCTIIHPISLVSRILEISGTFSTGEHVELSHSTDYSRIRLGCKIFFLDNVTKHLALESICQGSG